MMFLVGIGGFGIQRLKIRWDDEELSKLLYAFIYRTYDPAHFADSSYKLDPIVDEDHRPTWSITIGVKSRFGGAATERPVLCPNFLPLYSSSPFGTRTHVFATMGEGVDVDGGKLTVLKDQVCHRFDTHEIEILELVHKSKRVPGVVEAVYHKSIELPDQLDGLKVGKVKHRHGLRQLGSPFATIPTVKEMLQVAFNIIEVLRFLRVKQNILHRDISPGNVMYAPPSGDEQDPDTSMEDEEVLYFSEYFLSDSPVRPQTTSALLVDFNHAKHLTSETDGFHEPVDKTGTPGYMARAIEQGRPVDIPQWVPDRFLDSIPPAPDRYAKHYRDTRLKKFPPTPLKKVTEMLDSAPWRHDLDHDVESVFWLMLDWAMTAQPKGGAVEYIDDVVWLYFTGSVVGRHSLLSIGLLHGLLTDGTCHSTFRPIKGLFQKLAGVLSSMDRHWLPASEERNDPEYFAEAFQRLILPFLIDHNRDDDGFMDQPIDSSPRQVERRRSQGPWASTSPSVSHN
ncbi:hypothetical protein FRC01_007333 [Tulasnella sp. 417]|nr:hypothetical protein FRC01_007333 [Tulasnella sp. 417]